MSTSLYIIQINIKLILILNILQDNIFKLYKEFFTVCNDLRADILRKLNKIFCNKEKISVWRTIHDFHILRFIFKKPTLIKLY